MTNPQHRATKQRWHSMIKRCHDENNDSFTYYGGRGISVCDEWRNSFEQFIDDMGYPPSPGHQLGRIDNTGGFSKENCKYRTRVEQNRNRGNNRLLTINDRTQCCSAWAEEMGVSRKIISRRLINGWTPEDAVMTPHIKRSL